MFYGSTPQETRKIFYTSWQKYKTQSFMEPLEKQVAQIIEEHPEYHALLDNPQNSEKAFYPELGETNPFLHMGLHLAVREQVQLNRPAGIRDVYQQLQKKHSSSETEHLLMECLAECLWRAQRQGTPPSEEQYLQSCCALR